MILWEGIESNTSLLCLPWKGAFKMYYGDTAVRVWALAAANREMNPDSPPRPGGRCLPAAPRRPSFQHPSKPGLVSSSCNKAPLTSPGRYHRLYLNSCKTFNLFQESTVQHWARHFVCVRSSVFPYWRGTTISRSLMRLCGVLLRWCTYSN